MTIEQQSSKLLEQKSADADIKRFVFQLLLIGNPSIALLCYSTLHS